MSRALGIPILDLTRLALELPDAFDSLWWHALHPAGVADWQQDGETMQQARDRMKAERAEAKKRLG